MRVCDSAKNKLTKYFNYRILSTDAAHQKPNVIKVTGHSPEPDLFLFQRLNTGAPPWENRVELPRSLPSALCVTEPWLCSFVPWWCKVKATWNLGGGRPWLILESWPVLCALAQLNDAKAWTCLPMTASYWAKRLQWIHTQSADFHHPRHKGRGRTVGRMQTHTRTETPHHSSQKRIPTSRHFRRFINAL